MNKLSEKFLKERSEKDDRFFTVYAHYTPNFKSSIVTGKFYSRNDFLDLTKADMDLVERINVTKVKLPRQRYPWPVCESHNYGWYKPIVPIDKEDKRFYPCQKESDFVKHEIRLRQDRTMDRPKFTGIPFKLG